MGKIVSLMLFYKDGFDIKLPKKVDISLNKETEACFDPSSLSGEKFLESFKISFSKSWWKMSWYHK